MAPAPYECAAIFFSPDRYPIRTLPTFASPNHSFARLAGRCAVFGCHCLGCNTALRAISVCCALRGCTRRAWEQICVTARTYRRFTLSLYGWCRRRSLDSPHPPESVWSCLCVSGMCTHFTPIFHSLRSPLVNFSLASAAPKANALARRRGVRVARARVRCFAVDCGRHACRERPVSGWVRIVRIYFFQVLIIVFTCSETYFFKSSLLDCSARVFIYRHACHARPATHA